MKQEITKLAMWQGLILGGVFLLNFTFSTIFEKQSLQYIFAALVIFLLYYFTKQCRDNHLNGDISYGGAFAFMMLLGVYATMIASVGHFVFYKFIQPDYLAGQIEMAIDLVEQMNLQELQNDEDIVSTLYNTITPINMTFAYFFVDILYILFPSLIIAAVVKFAKPKVVEENAENQENN